ncbi:TonB-dependent receptor [Saprospiraceae bacterium]|nr:TonB-dependent receptor [Saprospiraceae bacterium]
MYYRFLLLTAFLFLPFCGFSQDVISSSQESKVSDSLLIKEVSIIADLPITKSTPLPIIRLNQNELRRDNGVSILPSLNRVAGLYIHSGALNTTRITIRGIGNRSLFSTSKIRAYIDDIPITTGIGESTIEDIDMSIIDHINVYKGPSSSIYGAGLGGVIQLVTHSERTSFTNQINTGVTIGSYGLKRLTSGISLTNKEETASLSLRYHNTSSDGYRENNNYDREGLQLFSVLKPNDKNTTTILVNYVDVNAMIPSSLSLDDFNNNPRAAAANWAAVNGFEDNKKLLLGINNKMDIAQLGGNYLLSNSSSLFSNYRDSYESRPFNILTETSTSLGGRSSLVISKDTTAVVNTSSLALLRATIGVEYYNERYTGQTFVTNGGVLGDMLSNNRERRSYVNLFLQSEFSLAQKWRGILGVNVNHTNYNLEDRFLNDGIDLSGDYSFDRVVSPGLGISYQLSNLTIMYANVSHGFSPPTLEETLTPDGNINPDIRPEKGWNYEIGSRGTLIRKLDYELSLYHMSVTDLLVARRISEDQFVGINAGKTRHNGLESMMTYRVIEGRDKLSIFTSYAYSDFSFVDFVDGENDFSGNELTGTARHHVNVGVDMSCQLGLYGNINYKYLSSFPIRDDNSIFSDAYQLVNLRVGYKKLFRSLQIDFSVGIQNVFDETYASQILINASSFGGNPPRYYYPGLPRNYDASIRLKYYL